MINMICIIGRTASGKDTIANKIINNNFLHVFGNGDYEQIVSVTTRPKRDTETDGVEHIFVTDEVYDKIEDDDKIAETKIGKYRYCATLSQLSEDINYVYIIDPKGYLKMRENFRDINIFTIYVNCDRDTRKQRYNTRSIQTGKDTFDERDKAEDHQFDIFEKSMRDKYFDNYPVDIYIDMVINTERFNYKEI